MGLGTGRLQTDTCMMSAYSMVLQKHLSMDVMQAMSSCGFLLDAIARVVRFLVQSPTHVRPSLVAVPTGPSGDSMATCVAQRAYTSDLFLRLRKNWDQ